MICVMMSFNMLKVTCDMCYDVIFSLFLGQLSTLNRNLILAIVLLTVIFFVFLVYLSLSYV